MNETAAVDDAVSAMLEAQPTAWPRRHTACRPETSSPDLMRTHGNIFLSHADRDREIAEVVAEAVQRASLRQIDVWFSSDSSPSGGMGASRTWVDQVMERLRQTTTMLVLVTPRSVERPWLHFECGHVAGRPDTQVYPICFNIDSTSVPLPLALYQTYSLTDAQSFSTLLAKLAGRFDLHYDAQMALLVVKDALARLGRIQAEPETEKALTPGLDEAVARIQGHFDRRFMELARIPTEEDDDALEYSVPILIEVTSHPRESHVLITRSTTLQDLLDSIYFGISDYVEPYRYLEQWVLIPMVRDPQPLIIRGVQQDVLASAVLRPGVAWRVVGLKRPYIAGQPLELSTELKVRVRP